MKWIIGVVVLAVLLLGALGFGIWAFGERQNYKNNVDGIVADAVKVAEKETTDKNNKVFAEELKNPFKSYVGPESYGSVKITYPKTWSGYINNGDSSRAAVDMYFHPDIVPASGRSGENTVAVALHIQVVDQAYDKLVVARNSAVKSGKLTAAPYALPKMPSEPGMKFVGQLDNKVNGTEIVLPLRDKSIVITTQTDTYLNDFNNIILPNLTFVP